MSRHLSPLALSRSAHYRDAVTRIDPDRLAALWADQSTRVLLLNRGRSLLAEGSPSQLSLVTPAEAGTVELTIYLGVDGTEAPRALFAAAISDGDARRFPDRWVSLLSVGADLDPLHAGLFTQALAMVNWHSGFGYSPRTGDPTSAEDGGWVRRAADRQDIFPRTDPAVIMRVHDEQGRILLGRNAAWGQRFSLLAGFVEPGESLEAAVIREVREEAGLTVTDVRYLGSQPWPFPASLMVAFSAVVEGPTMPVPDGVEIVELRWFSRAELEAEDFLLPGAISIARIVIDDWVRGEDAEGA